MSMIQLASQQKQRKPQGKKQGKIGEGGYGQLNGKKKEWEAKNERDDSIEPSRRPGLFKR